MLMLSFQWNPSVARMRAKGNKTEKEAKQILGWCTINLATASQRECSSHGTSTERQHGSMYQWLLISCLLAKIYCILLNFSDFQAVLPGLFGQLLG